MRLVDNPKPDDVGVHPDDLLYDESAWVTSASRQRIRGSPLALAAPVPKLLNVDVGHACNVIGDRAGEAFCRNLRLVILGE